jgi:hypothetical protein
MFPFILLAILIILGHPLAYAQTISIVNMDNSREAIVMETVLKRLLRAEGYTIQGIYTEGYVVLLHGMAAHTTKGSSVGVVGSAAVVKVLGGASAAALLPEGSSRGNEFVETFTAVMGSPVIYLAGSTAVGGDAEQVAEILSRYVNMAVRQSSRLAHELVRALEKSVKKQEPAPLSGTGREGGALPLP